MYGISQNSDTKDYIMVFHEGIYCEKCGKKYTNKWCKPCQMNNLKKNFTIWTSGNKIIDDHIQEMQSKFNQYNDIVFEWIPYKQFNDIREIGKDDFAVVYSAIWKNGPLVYDDDKKEYARNKNIVVNLKCLYNSQDITNEFINEV